MVVSLNSRLESYKEEEEGWAGLISARVLSKAFDIHSFNRTRVGTFENHCLEGKLTFGDPFFDSGVVRPG